LLVDDAAGWAIPQWEYVILVRGGGLFNGLRRVEATNDRGKMTNDEARMTKE